MRGMAREYAAGNSLGPGWRESAGIFGCPVDGSVADGAVRPGVEWTKRRQHEWEAEGNYATPPSPFHRLLTFAQRPNGRAGTGLRSGPGCISGVSVHYKWDVASWVSMVNLVIRHY